MKAKEIDKLMDDLKKYRGSVGYPKTSDDSFCIEVAVDDVIKYLARLKNAQKHEQAEMLYAAIEMTHNECPFCSSLDIEELERSPTQSTIFRYACQSCGKRWLLRYELHNVDEIMKCKKCGRFADFLYDSRLCVGCEPTEDDEDCWND